MAFIANERASSKAETLLGVVEALRLGDIVGAPTAGTNGQNNRFRVPGGFVIGMTADKVLKHDGSRHHGVGALPTVAVRPTLAGVRAGRDELLEWALDVVERSAP